MSKKKPVKTAKPRKQRSDKGTPRGPRKPLDQPKRRGRRAQAEAAASQDAVSAAIAEVEAAASVGALAERATRPFMQGYMNAGKDHPANLPEGKSCLCPHHLSMVVDLGELKREWKGYKVAQSLIREEERIRKGLPAKPARAASPARILSDVSDLSQIGPSGLEFESAVFADGDRARSKVPVKLLAAIGAGAGSRLVFHLFSSGAVTVKVKGKEDQAGA